MEHQNVASKVVRQQGFLRSHDQSDVAAALSEILLNVVSDSDVANSLRTIRDQVWLPDSSDRITPKPIADHKRKKQLFDEALNGLDSNQKKLLFESYARMGELYELYTSYDNGHR